MKEEINARATGTGLAISTKSSIEICNHLRGKKVSEAKKILENVIVMKSAIPYKRFNGDTGHKKNIGPGRYPQKACKEILKILKSAEKNADIKEMNNKLLFISEMMANQGSRGARYGRHHGRQTKNTHIDIVLSENKEKKVVKKNDAGKEVLKEEKKK